MTEKENKRFLPLLSALDALLDDPMNLLFAWAEASSDEMLKNSVVAEYLKKKGTEMGITEEEFQRAADTKKAVDRILGDDKNDNVAQS